MPKTPRTAILSNPWIMLGVLFVVRTSFGYQFQSVASVSSFQIDDLAIGYTEVGTLIGLYMLPGVVIAMPSGLLSKRFGDKRISSYGLLLMVAGATLMGLSQSYALAVAGRLVSGVGAVLLNVVVTKMVTDWFAEREIRTALGVMLASWPFGIALGLVSQSAVADAYSWRTVMYLTAALSALAFVLVASMYRTPRSGTASGEGASLFMLPMRELLPVSMAGLAWAVFNIGFAIHFSFTPDLLTGRGMTTADAGALTSIAIWITMFSVPLGGYLAERSGWPNAMIVAFSLLAAITLGLFPFLAFPVALSVLFGLWIGPPPGAMVALPSQVLGPDNRGPGLGVFYTWFYLGMAVGPAIAGAGRDLTGSAAAAPVIGAVLFALVLPFLAMFRLFQGKAAPIHT